MIPSSIVRRQKGLAFAGREVQDEEKEPAMDWTILAVLASAFSAAALACYIRKARRAGDRVLAAHGIILLVGLCLAGAAVCALRVWPPAL